MSQEHQPRLPHPKTHNQDQLLIHLKKPASQSSSTTTQLCLPRRPSSPPTSLPPAQTPTADTLRTPLFGGSPDGIEPPW